MYYYFCPNCEYEEMIHNIPKGAVGNPRDGCGRGVYHFECPRCCNLDAGCMALQHNDSQEKEYIKSVIKMYQAIRGFPCDAIDETIVDAIINANSKI